MCAGSKVDLETQLSTVRRELTKVQTKSEELNGKLDQCQKQVADLKSRGQQCNTMLTSLKVGYTLGCCTVCVWGGCKV